MASSGVCCRSFRLDKGPAQAAPAFSGTVPSAAVTSGCLSTAVSIDTRGPAATAGPADLLAPVRRARAGGSRLLTIAWLCWVYDAITNLAPLRLHLALAHGEGVLSLERSLHIDPERVARPLARRAPHAGAARLRLLRQRPLHRHARPARLAVVAPRRHLPAAAQHARARQRARVRRLLAVPGRAAADAAGLHRRGRQQRTRSAPGTAARSPRTPTSSPRCPRCTSPGRCGARWSSGGSRGACGCGVLAVIYPCVTALAVLSTGNHFVIDILGGLVVIALSALIVGLAERRGRALAPPRAASSCRCARARAGARWRGPMGRPRAAHEPVAHVTNLLRSLRPDRLTPPPQIVEGHFDGSAAESVGTFSSVGWPYEHARLRRQRAFQPPARCSPGGPPQPRSHGRSSLACRAGARDEP